MPRLIIDISCNGRVCDDCGHLIKVNGRGERGICNLFDIGRLEHNGDDDFLRCNECLKAESNIPDRVVKDYS